MTRRFHSAEQANPNTTFDILSAFQGNLGFEIDSAVARTREDVKHNQDHQVAIIEQLAPDTLEGAVAALTASRIINKIDQFEGKSPTTEEQALITLGAVLAAKAIVALQHPADPTS